MGVSFRLADPDGESDFGADVVEGYYDFKRLRELERFGSLSRDEDGVPRVEHRRERHLERAREDPGDEFGIWERFFSSWRSVKGSYADRYPGRTAPSFDRVVVGDDVRLVVDELREMKRELQSCPDEAANHERSVELGAGCLCLFALHTGRGIVLS